MEKIVYSNEFLSLVKKLFGKTSVAYAECLEGKDFAPYLKDLENMRKEYVACLNAPGEEDPYLCSNIISDIDSCTNLYTKIICEYRVERYKEDLACVHQFFD